ncbi:Bicoid-interacting protein 3-domain-containing protein [Mycena floridula]|nr:Bicoid-interacting protein 3-domain-containing protein [Mycena floridula]
MFAAPVHGNYHGYYLKRPSVKDPRLALFPRDTFQGKRVLDIGCNEGWVTCEIAQSWGPRKVVGVDIDETLIRGAWRRRQAVWSLQAPMNTKKRKRENETETETSSPQADYFPASLLYTFDSLPIPPQTEKNSFPHNVSFRTADWASDGIPEDEEGHDVVIAFSISKWIHLNGGDEGLTRFFRRVHSVLKPGGAFILEPQAWETYKQSKRYSEILKENAKHIKLRPENFGSVLESMGFAPPQDFGFTGDGGFRRPVHLYVKR